MTPKHASIKRNYAEWQPDFTATRSQDGIWKASHSFKCHSADALTLTPIDGTPCTEEGFGLLGFSGATITKEGGLIATVTCEYAGTDNETEYTFDDKNKTFELNKDLAEEPLERHPKYYENVDDFVVAGIRDGTIIRYDEGDGVVIYIYTHTDSEGKMKEEWITDVDDLTDECVRYIVSGEDSYLSPRATWTVNIPSGRKVSASDMDKFGLIDNSPLGNPPTPQGYSWLFVGITQTKTGNLYDITMSWMLSSPRGWNEDFYKEH